MDNTQFKEPSIATLRVSTVMLSSVREDDWHRCRIWKSMDMQGLVRHVLERLCRVNLLLLFSFLSLFYRGGRDPGEYIAS